MDKMNYDGGLYSTSGTDDAGLRPSMPNATEWEDQFSPHAGHGGGNISGHDPKVDLFMVPSFQGMSGEANNQSTFRPKGST